MLWRWPPRRRLVVLRLVEARFDAGEAHVGSARRLALDIGAAWLEADGCPDGALLTTDADAVLAPDWVRANLLALDRADIVGGRLVIDADGPPDAALADLHERVERYWSAVRALEDRLDPPLHDPAPRHGDHTGASLAVRVWLYRAVGGLPALARGEDNAFVARVQETGGRLRHCPAVQVRVSDRRVGRAEGGMASEMARRAAVAAGGAAYRLPAAGHWQAMIARRAALRRIWRETGAGPASERALLGLGLTRDDIAAVSSGTCANDIAFVERACRRLARSDAEPPTVGIDTALAQFDALMRRLDAGGPRRAVV